MLIFYWFYSIMEKDNEQRTVNNFVGGIFMKNNIKKSLVGLGVIVIIMGSTFVFSEPGTDADPLVTLSYVNKAVDQIKDYIDMKISNISSGTSSSNELVIVNLKQGEYLIGKAGTEMILRGGKAKAVGSALGGLSDVTQGDDLGHDQMVPHNHLLIIPRDDGRGILATTDAIFMVRGDYTVK